MKIFKIKRWRYFVRSKKRTVVKERKFEFKRLLDVAGRARGRMDTWIGRDSPSWGNERHGAGSGRFSQVWILRRAGILSHIMFLVRIAYTVYIVVNKYGETESVHSQIYFVSFFLPFFLSHN